MNGGKRPGGLTALAVLNFVGSGVDVLLALGLVFTFWGAPFAVKQIEKQRDGFQEQLDEAREERQAGENPNDISDLERTLERQLKSQEDAITVLKAWDPVHIGLKVLLLVMTGLLAALLITCGVGYLKQKKFLGRGIGNAYALLSLASFALEMGITPPEVGGIVFLNLLFLIYPLVTLFLLNTTFKHDFVS